MRQSFNTCYHELKRKKARAAELIDRLPIPHPGQQYIIDRAKRFNVVNCGRRFGKSILGERISIQTAAQGFPFGYFAATYKILDEVFRDLCNITQGYGKVNRSKYRIELDCGGLIECWSLESDGPGRSRKYKGIAVDEAALARMLEEQWRECIRPTLSDLQGDAWFLSTPSGRNFFYQLHLIGVDDQNKDWAYFHAPTASNPFILPSEIESARLDPSMTEQTFAQEYLAVFLEDSGAVFRRVLDAIDKDRLPTPPEHGRSYAVGLDLARYQDFSVITVFDDTGKQVYFDRFNQISWDRQIQAVVEVLKMFSPMKVFIDQTSVGDPVVEQIRKAVNELPEHQRVKIPSIEGMVFNNANKDELINNYALDIETGRRSLLDIPVQTSELLAYEYERTTAGNLRMNAPVGMHDDTVIAGALANKGVRYIGPVTIKELPAPSDSSEGMRRRLLTRRKNMK